MGVLWLSQREKTMWVNWKKLELVEIVLLFVQLAVTAMLVYYLAVIKCDALGVEFNFVNAVLRW